MNSDRLKLLLWLRAAYFTLGVGLLFWLPIEDTTPETPFVFSAGFVTLAAIHRWIRSVEPPYKRIWTRYPASGMILGITIPLLTVCLMIFKNGMHAHGFPDFSPSDLAGVIGSTPWSAFAGGLCGLAASYWRWRKCR